MKIIYSAANYVLSSQGDFATLSNGTRTQTLPLRQGVDEIPPGLAAALKRAGHHPADYFCVAGTHVIRRAALEAWTAAVEARIAEREAEAAERKAAIAREIAERGRRALALHDAYLTKASLLFVREMHAEEAARLAPWYAARALVPLGEWTAIDPAVADEFLTGRDRQNDYWLSTGESRVILISEAEWDALLARDRARVEAARAAKAEAETAEAARIEAARQQAEQRGEPVEIDRAMDECDGTATDCSFDLVRRMIRGDGSRFTLRTHGH